MFVEAAKGDVHAQFETSPLETCVLSLAFVVGWGLAFAARGLLWHRGFGDLKVPFAAAVGAGPRPQARGPRPGPRQCKNADSRPGPRTQTMQT